MMPKILSFGEIIWDVYENEALIGGAPLNFAAHAKRCGANSFMISAVGCDKLGEDALKTVNAFNVDTSFIKTAPFPTGKCEVTLNESGVPSYNVLSDTAFDNIVLSDADIEEIKKQRFDALYFGTLIQRNSVSRAALKKLCRSCLFKEIICDINLRKNCYDENSARFCLDNATVLKISDEEEPLLREFKLYDTKGDSCEEIAMAICSSFKQIKHLIITLGEKGSFVFESATKHSFFVPSKKTTVASTVGAGDSYIAAWCTSLLKGTSVEEATKNATMLSSYVVSCTEAIPHYTFENGIFKAK